MGQRKPGPRRIREEGRRPSEPDTVGDSHQENLQADFMRLCAIDARQPAPRDLERFHVLPSKCAVHGGTLNALPRSFV